MPKETTCFKNVFDKKGNIITSEEYVNDKLLNKQIFEISYKQKNYIGKKWYLVQN